MGIMDWADQVSLELDAPRLQKITEKPAIPDSKYAQVGLYIYDCEVFKHIKTLKPSERGEFEVTDLNNIYLKNGLLKYKILDDGVFWCDAGTYDSMHVCSTYMKSIHDIKH